MGTSRVIWISASKLLIFRGGEQWIALWDLAPRLPPIYGGYSGRARLSTSSPHTSRWPYPLPLDTDQRLVCANSLY
jgi:hypothetical protein